MDSQSGLGWQGPFEAHPAQLLPWQGPLPPAQAAPSPVQPGLEPSQGWGSHSFSGHPVPGPQHPQRRTFLPDVQPHPPSLRFKLCLSTQNFHLYPQSFGPSFGGTFQQLEKPDADGERVVWVGCGRGWWCSARMGLAWQPSQGMVLAMAPNNVGGAPRCSQSHCGL